MSSAPDNAVPATTDAPAPADIDAPVLAAPVARSSVATDIALIATFAAFIAVCAIIGEIKTGSSVPITLQTFGVILTGLVLGWWRGALAVLLYLALGLIGLPIFAEHTGGVAVLGKPSAGYLLAFPLGAALAGYLATVTMRAVDRYVPAGRPALRSTWRYVALFLSGLTASFLTIHLAGIAGLIVKLGLTFREALAIDVVFWPGDVVKNLAAAGVALAIFRAFPDLLRNRR